MAIIVCKYRYVNAYRRISCLVDLSVNLVSLMRMHASLLMKTFVVFLAYFFYHLNLETLYYYYYFKSFSGLQLFIVWNIVNLWLLFRKFVSHSNEFLNILIYFTEYLNEIFDNKQWILNLHNLIKYGISQEYWELLRGNRKCGNVAFHRIHIRHRWLVEYQRSAIQTNRNHEVKNRFK